MFRLFPDQFSVHQHQGYLSIYRIHAKDFSFSFLVSHLASLDFFASFFVRVPKHFCKYLNSIDKLIYLDLIAHLYQILIYSRLILLFLHLREFHSRLFQILPITHSPLLLLSNDRVEILNCDIRHHYSIFVQKCQLNKIVGKLRR